MKRFNKYLDNFQNLIYGKSNNRFEDRLLLLTTFSMALMCIIAAFFNLLVGLKATIVISTALGSLLFLGLYLLGRIYHGSLYVWTTSLITLLYVDLVWFLNYGSNGPVMAIFIVFYAFLILVFDKKYFFLISIIIFSNLTCLFLIELEYYEEIGNYPDLLSRQLDTYIGTVFNILVAFFFISTIKKNYIRAYERAKMSDQLKSAFVANMSHEIRTPLNAIVGFSSLMSDPDIPPDDKKMFEEQVQRNSDYLLSLIEDIIDVSKIESNQLTVNIHEVDIVPMIRQITKSFQFTIPSGKNVKVLANLAMPKLLVNVDLVRLEQILRNLLSNAVKFTDEGIIEVSCQKGKEYYTFSVRDTGIGIHTDHQQVIFDRFMKIENNKQHLYRGTGIGLFLSKQLVEMFGGKIWVKSEEGKGSNFYFTIPV